MTISVCMIVKNEEKNLADCLNCLQDIADEIIIGDTGSTDSTKTIASKYTDKVYDFEWIDDFAAARNFLRRFRFVEFMTSVEGFFNLVGVEKLDRVAGVLAKDDVRFLQGFQSPQGNIF